MSTMTRTSRIALKVAVSTTAAMLLASDAQAAKVVNTYDGLPVGNFSLSGDDWSLDRVPGTHGADHDNARIDGAVTVTLNENIVASSPRIVGIHAINGATLEMVAGADVYLVDTHWSDGVFALGGIANVTDSITPTGNGHFNVSGGKLNAKRVALQNASTLTMTGGVVESRSQDAVRVYGTSIVDISGDRRVVGQAGSRCSRPRRGKCQRRQADQRWLYFPQRDQRLGESLRW